MWLFSLLNNIFLYCLFHFIVLFIIFLCLIIFFYLIHFNINLFLRFYFFILYLFLRFYMLTHIFLFFFFFNVFFLVLNFLVDFVLMLRNWLELGSDKTIMFVLNISFISISVNIFNCIDMLLRITMNVIIWITILILRSALNISHFRLIVTHILYNMIILIERSALNISISLTKIKITDTSALKKLIGV